MANSLWKVSPVGSRERFYNAPVCDELSRSSWIRRARICRAELTC